MVSCICPGRLSPWPIGDGSNLVNTFYPLGPSLPLTPFVPLNHPATPEHFRGRWALCPIRMSGMGESSLPDQMVWYNEIAAAG